MSALHHTLIQTPMNMTLSKNLLPPFTALHLKAGLRTTWKAEQIGRQDFVLNPDLLMSSIQYGIESAFVF